MKQVSDFLAKVGAHFQNFVLNEPEEVWSKKLDIAGPPLIVVFGRHGRVVKRFVGGYEEVRPFVEKVLNEQGSSP